MVTLNDQQKAAVETDSKKVMVLAGAGSGKTRVLIERIADLVEHKKISPFEILSFTFTRKAAGEMKSRLEARIGNAAHRVTMGTMHAIGLNMITRFGEIIGHKAERVTVYSQWEEDYLIKEIARELGIYGKTWNPPKKDIYETLFKYYTAGIEPEPYDHGYHVFKKLVSVCHENNALTYGAILIGLRLLIPTMQKNLHIRHILVDEVQDIDPLQWMIINEMVTAFGTSLFVVGDIDQCVYEFRNAVPGYLIDHQHEFDIYKLETNYRSGIKIVESANRLIKNNTDRISKTMIPHSTESGKVEVAKNIDTDAMVKLIKEIGTGEIAIIGRIHVILQKLSESLNDAGIPHTYIGKKSALTNSEEFRRVHAFLKLMVNPFDNFSTLLCRELLGLSLEEYASIRVHAASEGVSHYQAWRNLFVTQNEFGALFYRLDSYDFLGAIGIMAELVWPFETALIFDFMREWEDKNQGWRSEKCDEGALQAYLKWLATYDIQDEVAEGKTGIQILSVHAAKGLEWPTVIVAGCNEEILPSKQAIKSGDIEGERRLAYVAWTRAEKHLILTVRPESKEYKGKAYKNPISRFIEESV